MKNQRKVIFISVILGFLAWATDAYIDNLFFGEGESSLWDSLIDEVSSFKIYLRSSAFLIIVAFGLIMAHILEKRKQAEDLFKSLALSSPVGIFIVQNRVFQFVNPAFQKDTGYSERELLGKESLTIVIPEDRDMVREKAVKMLKTFDHNPYEYRSLDKSGNTRWIMEAVASIGYKGKQATIGTYIDITARKRVEIMLEQSYENEKELRQNLETEIKRRVDFNRVLVHELKTPIVPIVAAGDLLAEEIHDEQLLALVKRIQIGASKMDKRIDTLLDVAKSELGLLELSRDKVDILKLLNRVAEETSPLASKRRISLVLEIPPSLPAVWCDESRIEQVITNILANALKWTPQDGQITLRAMKQGTALKVEIQDTGPGINEENWQKIFQAYYQVIGDNERLSGLGLGLALSKSIIEAHNGKIWVESDMGIGSTFSFSIPISQ